MALHVYLFRLSVGLRRKVNFTTLALLSLRMVPFFSNRNNSLGSPLSTVHCNVNSSPAFPSMVPWFATFSNLRFVGGSINKFIF